MKIKDAIEILRPINALMGGLTVIIGVLNTRIGIEPLILIFNIILGVLTYFFISGSGMIINDYYDIEIDKINRPDRPIPRGSITLKQAKIWWIITILIGIGIAVLHSVLFRIGYLNIIIAAFFTFIGWLYAAWGKKSGFIGKSNLIAELKRRTKEHRERMQRKCAREYYQEHKEKKKEYDKIYRQKHKKEISEQYKRYYQKHKKERREYNRRYRLKNRDKILNKCF